MDESKRKKPSVFKRALLNQYNLIMLGGVGMFALATGTWLPLVVGAGAEVLWLALGADTGVFRRWVDKQDAKDAKQAALREATRLLSSLDAVYVQRFETLRRGADEIERLAQENKGLETALVKDEMGKLGELLHSFLKLSAAHHRLARYLHDNPVSDIERDIARCQRALKQETDTRVQASLKQALNLAHKRLKQHQQIEGGWKALSVQMDTLEKAFDYLKSHILGIGTREELAQELDDMVNGVSTVSEIEASTDELMQELRATGGARVVNLGKGS